MAIKSKTGSYIPTGKDVEALLGYGVLLFLLVVINRFPVDIAIVVKIIFTITSVSLAIRYFIIHLYLQSLLFVVIGALAALIFIAVR